MSDESGVLELAILDVKPSLEEPFEAAFERAERILAAADGYLGHELQRCVEKASRYVLLVRWETLEHHTEGFRGSPVYAEWSALLHSFYDPFPVVEHYRPRGDRPDSEPVPREEDVPS